MPSEAAAPPSPAKADSPFANGQPDEVARYLRVLGLAPEASWDDICRARARLVSDLTPGADANHGKVDLANSLLGEVNTAFDALRALSSVA